MRWEPAPVPERRQRTRTKFAWVPRCMDDKTIVWLEEYVAHEAYIINGRRENSPHERWEVRDGWVEVKREVLNHE